MDLLVIKRILPTCVNAGHKLIISKLDYNDIDQISEESIDVIVFDFDEIKHIAEQSDKYTMSGHSVSSLAVGHRLRTLLSLHAKIAMHEWSSILFRVNVLLGGSIGVAGGSSRSRTVDH